MAAISGVVQETGTDVVNSVRKYLRVLQLMGVHAERAILFGSYAKGTQHEWSDIDLLVVAPEFDGDYTNDQIVKLWHATLDSDIRIEPVPCGVCEWESGKGEMIIDIARHEGIEIAL